MEQVIERAIKFLQQFAQFRNEYKLSYTKQDDKYYIFSCDEISGSSSYVTLYDEVWYQDIRFRYQVNQSSNCEISKVKMLLSDMEIIVRKEQDGF